jgi:3,4-dihydroxy 2-butanone 4-phosphate synthase/GTP cyclohydrolase II
MSGFGLDVVERVPLPVHFTDENTGYLMTKRDRMGHDLPGLPAMSPLPPIAPTAQTPPLPSLPHGEGTRP